MFGAAGEQRVQLGVLHRLLFITLLLTLSLALMKVSAPVVPSRTVIVPGRR